MSRKHGLTGRVLDALKRLPLIMLKSIVAVGTFPYYRIFQFNTLAPILRIAHYSSRPAQSRKLLQLLVRWRTRKLAELQFISIACAIIAAAVIGSFSWNAAFDAYWLAPSLWYSSLVLSILGLLLSTQQIAVLHLLDADDVYGEPGATKMEVSRYLPLMVTEQPQNLIPADMQRDGRAIRKYRPRWKMVFIWQCPMMFMSYSVCLYLAGLLIYVCTPLIRGDGWNSGSDTAIFFLTIFTLAIALLMFCSFWIYHYVDLEYESQGMNFTERDNDT